LNSSVFSISLRGSLAKLIASVTTLLLTYKSTGHISSSPSSFTSLMTRPFKSIVPSFSNLILRLGYALTSITHALSLESIIKSNPRIWKGYPGTETFPLATLTLCSISGPSICIVLEHVVLILSLIFSTSLPSYSSAFHKAVKVRFVLVVSSFKIYPISFFSSTISLSLPISPYFCFSPDWFSSLSEVLRESWSIASCLL